MSSCMIDRRTMVALIGGGAAIPLLPGAAEADGGPDGKMAGDSAVTTLEGALDLDLFPDQILCLAMDFGWFRGSLGAHTLNLGYRGRRNLLSGLSPLEWDGDPLVPILNFGFTWGHPLVFSADFHVTPLPAVRTGMAYGF